MLAPNNSLAKHTMVMHPIGVRVNARTALVLTPLHIASTCRHSP